MKEKASRHDGPAQAGAEDCVFCKIVGGALPAFAVFEDELTLAFLDKRPLFAGHCLLVPKEHHRTLADLPEHIVPRLFLNARLLARAVERALDAEGTFVALNNRVSQSVPHLHVHVVPRRRGDGLKGFFWPRRPYRDEGEMREVQKLLRAAVAELRDDTE